MPIHRGVERGKGFYQWGKSGKKYFYTISDKKSREAAYKKALKQARAIYASGYVSK